MNTNNPNEPGDKGPDSANAGGSGGPVATAPPPSSNSSPTGGNPPASATGGNAPPPSAGGTTPPPSTGGSTMPPPSTDGSGPIVGDDGVLQPVADVANGAVTELNREVNQISDTVGLGNVIADATAVLEATGLGAIGDPIAPDGDGNLITHLVQAPTMLLSGNLDGTISDVSGDLTDVLTPTSELKDEVLLDGNDPVNVVPELVQSVGSGLQSQPLLNLGGSSLLGGTVGDLSQSSSGHLINLDLGSSDNGLSVDLLSAPAAGNGSALGIHVLDVGANGPSLLNLQLLGGDIPLLGGTDGGGLLGGVTGVLDGSGSGLLGNVLPQLGSEGGGLLGGVLDIPTLGGTGTDALVGNLLGSVAPPSGGETEPPVALPTLGIVSEVVADVTHALDTGQTEHNHGLLGVL